jgi:SAM-dependent methyltransferase
MSLRSRGVLGTASHFLERLADRRFDALHHVETTAKVPPYALGVESASHANEYTPVPTSGLSRVLADLPIDYREWDFVDIGAGKGRALFVAARFEFQRIIGVELSADLVHLARRNIISYRDPRQGCFDLTVTHEDAQRYQLLGSTIASVVLYLFDPFNDVATMEQMLENVQKWLESGDHKLYVIYWHPRLAEPFKQSPALKLVRATSEYHLYEGLPCCPRPSDETKTPMFGESS